MVTTPGPVSRAGLTWLSRERVVSLSRSVPLRVEPLSLKQAGGLPAGTAAPIYGDLLASKDQISDYLHIIY